MAKPNIPAAKRAGLPVDFDRLTAEGDAWLTPEDRYALKTHGICTQLQDGVFMVRIRIPGGVLPTTQARMLARIARRFGPDWLHYTTRQNVELHWVEAKQIQPLMEELRQAGLSTRSACGHTLRNVLCSEDAGVGLDEPFDCFPDARAVSDAIVARSERLNVTLPSRINISFGGSERCVADARINDAGFIARVRDGVPGYALWAGGSLGKSPSLSVELADFVPREDVLAAADALIEVFIEHGNFDEPLKGRMKHAVEKLGADGFRATWEQALAAAKTTAYPAPSPVDVLPAADHLAILTHRPEGGWSPGVRPQRQPGRALVTVDIPLGDSNGSELELLSDLADRVGDGSLVITRDQNITLRNVELSAVPVIREIVAVRGLHLLGEGVDASIRACTGSAVCALGITSSPDAGRTLLKRARLLRNSGLKLFISGCPNACAQHQVADIGLSGSKVRINGVTGDGYQVWLGADLAAGRIGEIAGRVAVVDLPDAVDAVVGAWEGLRRENEPLSATVTRIGVDAFAAQIGAQLPDRWEPGPELDVEPELVGQGTSR